ncbi:unnamed protein product, partial [marine sediment metagenome]
MRPVIANHEILFYIRAQLHTPTVDIQKAAIEEMVVLYQVRMTGYIC